ncbi:MAG: SDR family NAD(P)-dependent oxidoreductase [Acidimicrobiales bacterium]|nr:SDR family NAD(P)-dependent oxidoreductase [Acidimicrobiales bacterium]
MKNLEGKVAVITGGASGLGRAFAQRFAAQGMKLALADIEEPVLDATVAELRASGAEVIGVPCDVSDQASVQNFHQQVMETYGTAHVLCLNAGVAGGGTIAELTAAQWDWVLGVNLYGIIYGLEAFLPGLLAQDDGHVVLTASVAGHTSYAGMAPYNASKHATVTIAETLFAELRQEDSAVGVSCLCPGFVATNIFVSDRNQPEELTEALAEPPSEEDATRRAAIMEYMQANALRPETVADLVHDAVMDKKFWIFTDEEHLATIATRHEEIRHQSSPTAEAIFDNI